MEMALDVRKKKKRAWLIVFGVAGAVGLVFLVPIVQVAIDAYNAGFFDESEQGEYDGTSMDNMRSLYQATMLYYEAEGAMPHASGWMDAAKSYVRTADLLEGEEMKKFVNPNFPPGPGVYGYAMNSVLSEAYLDELEDPARTPMIFDSGDTRWNAFGLPSNIAPNPELPGGNKAVTAEGNVVELRELLGEPGE